MWGELRQIAGRFGVTRHLLFRSPWIVLAVLFQAETALASVAPGDLVIREFRLRGPSSSADEYIVIHNRTASDITIAASDASGGFGVASSDGNLIFAIPNGTMIKARGHFLGVNISGFSLGTPYNASWTTDIADGLGLALWDSANPAAFGSTATAIDAVGVGSSAAPYLEGTALTSLTAPGEYAWTRLAPGTVVQDTNDSTADFLLVATDGGVYNSVQSILGAPLPASTANQDVYASMGIVQVEPNVNVNANPNRVRIPTPVDRLEFRRRVTNNSGTTIAGIRARFVNLATLNSPGYSNPTQADLRPNTSATTSITPTSIGVSSVQGLVLLTPPAQPIGGGWNSSLVFPGGLAPGASIDVTFALRVSRVGSYVFLATLETLGTIPVSAPVMTPPGGSYGATQSVSLGTPTAGASIYYTTDGSTPTASSTLYTGTPILVDQAKTIRAIAMLANWADSEVSSATYTLAPSTPVFTPAAGTYFSPQAVTISTATSGATIRYTQDGSEPTEASALYTAPVPVGQTTTLRAKAFLPNWTDSPTGIATYLLYPAAPPWYVLRYGLGPAQLGVPPSAAGTPPSAPTPRSLPAPRTAASRSARRSRRCSRAARW